MAQNSKNMQASTPNDRLKYAINNLDDTVGEISEKTGIPKRTIYNLFEEGATIKSDYLIALNEEYGIDPSHILVGSEKYGTETEIAAVNDKGHVGRYSLKEDEEFYTVPFYASVKASAGGGLIPNEREPLEIAFRKYFINKSLGAQASDLFAMKISGDSMAPTLQDDDLVLVDKLKRQPRAGNILVIRIDETVSCKRIQELPGHRFKIMSDNQAYESFEIPADEEGFEIIGQVIWFGRNL